jgi:predicted Zn-dependent protease
VNYVPRELRETADVSRGRFDARDTARRVLRLAAVLVVAYVALGFVAEGVATWLPTSWEARLIVPERWATVGDHEVARTRAQATLERLLAAGTVRPLPYRLVVVETATPNAFAIPGGTIGVTSGLIERVESERGLAMVLAHELGHHHERHTVRRLGRALLLYVPLALLLGDQGAVTTVTLQLAERRYSRTQERAADALGLRLVHAAYGDTRGALEFFEEVQRETARGAGAWSGLAATHPPTAERIEALETLARELDGSGPRG